MVIGIAVLALSLADSNSVSVFFEPELDSQLINTCPIDDGFEFGPCDPEPPKQLLVFTEISVHWHIPAIAEGLGNLIDCLLPKCCPPISRGGCCGCDGWCCC